METAKELITPETDVLSPRTIAAYFDHYYWRRQGQWDGQRVLECLSANPAKLKYQFRTMNDRYPASYAKRA